MFVSDFPMSGSLLGAARCPETLTSPAKHARALPWQAQSKSSASSIMGRLRTCCLVLLRAGRKPKRCQGFCLCTVPAAHPASVGVMHPEVLLLVCGTIFSSHFSGVLGAIYWWKTTCGKKPMDFARTRKALPPRDPCQCVASAPRALAPSPRAGSLLINETQ